jgi:thiol-disulfide isomerase/thioredoxin
VSLRVRFLLVPVLLMAACSSPPEVETIEPAQWAEVLADHQGDVTVVNVWANWCRPCLDFLPSFVALREVENYEDVQFISVVVEDPADVVALGEATKLVLELDARFPHFALQTGVEETLEILGLDDLPGVLVYDAEGKLRYRIEREAFDGEMHLEDVEDAIDAALSGPQDGGT